MNDLQTTIRVHGAEGWKILWENNQTSWNIDDSAPPLREVFDLGLLDSLPSGAKARALVPGCGEGHDLLYLAGNGRFGRVFGLELSPIAKSRFENRATQLNVSEKASVQLEDFFTFVPPEQFDFIFDYTFFCAIQPSMREKWASQMSALLKPGGFLLTLMYPLGTHTDGPPFAVSYDAYHSLLSSNFDCVHGPVVTEKTIERRKGKEQVALWKRK